MSILVLKKAIMLGDGVDSLKVVGIFSHGESEPAGSVDSFLYMDVLSHD